MNEESVANERRTNEVNEVNRERDERRERTEKNGSFLFSLLFRICWPTALPAEFLRCASFSALFSSVQFLHDFDFPAGKTAFFGSSICLFQFDLVSFEFMTGWSRFGRNEPFCCICACFRQNRHWPAMSFISHRPCFFDFRDQLPSFCSKSLFLLVSAHFVFLWPMAFISSFCCIFACSLEVFRNRVLKKIAAGWKGVLPILCRRERTQGASETDGFAGHDSLTNLTKGRFSRTKLSRFFVRFLAVASPVARNLPNTYGCCIFSAVTVLNWRHRIESSRRMKELFGWNEDRISIVNFIFGLLRRCDFYW